MSILLAALMIMAPSVSSAAAQAIPLDQPGSQEEDIVVTGDKPDPDKPDPDKKVCKRSVATGSIMPTVTCRSVEEWEERTAKDTARVDQMKKDQSRERFVRDVACELLNRC